MSPYEKIETFDPHINVPMLKKSGNLFNHPRINVPIRK